MSSKNNRKRAVALALIAFFCTAATTYVAVDWKRFGGGFLAFLRGKGDPVVASGNGGGGGSTGGVRVASNDVAQPGASLPRLAPASSRRHVADGSNGAGGGHKSDEDLFKYGDPAAGGIPPGSFIVAQNETPSGGGDGPAPAPAAVPQVTSPPPGPGTDPGNAAPGPSNGGLNDTSLSNKPSGTPPAPPSDTTPTPPPVSTPPAGPVPPVASPPANDPSPPPPSGPSDPTQSGTTAPSGPVPPTSAVPEASTTSMMALGALFLAVAATRQRKKS